MGKLYTHEEVVEILEQFSQEAGSSYKASQLLGFTPPYIYRYTRAPDRSSLSPSLCHRLGVTKVTCYIGPNDPALLPIWNFLPKEKASA